MTTAGWTVECGLPLVDRYPCSHARTGLLKVLVNVERQTGSVKLKAADILGLAPTWLPQSSGRIKYINPTTTSHVPRLGSS